MIADLRPYVEYKELGLPWLGQVPEHWEVKRLKNWVAINEVTLPESTPSDYEFKYVDIGSVGTGRLSKTLGNHRFSASPSRARRVIRSGDTIVSTVRTYLKAVLTVSMVDEPLVASTGFAVLTPRGNTIPRCLGYVAQSQYFTNQVTGESVGIAYPAISETKLANIPVTFPPPSEQAAIVQFLDWANGRLERAIRAKRKVIALLNEQKQAIIHSAVTRGLDPKVRLKPSGVEWLGDVPEHWEVRKLRQCGSIEGGLTPSMEVRRFWDGTIPWVTPKDMKRVAIDDSSVRVTTVAIQETSLRLIAPPAILMVVRGMILARRVPIAWTTAPVTINQDMKALKPVQGVNAEFLARSLDSAQAAFIPLIDEAGHGTRRLPTERWRDLPVAMPPEAEQVRLVQFLNEATHAIVAAIQRAESEISLLREYRTRLIADVVTGKLDVREAVALPPSESDEQEPLDEADVLADAEVDGAADDANLDAAPNEVEA